MFKKQHFLSSLLRPEVILLLVCLFAAVSCKSPNPSALQTVQLSKVRVGGEIGRRMDISMKNNLLQIDIEEQFLGHFRQPSDTPQVRDGFCGIGMLIDALVKFSAYSNDSQIISLKNYLVDELIKTRDSDGYMGVYIKDRRKSGWDTHEGAYIITGLTNDYLYLGNQKSLEAARGLADYMISCDDGYICGFEQALLYLYKATSDKKYLEYCIGKLGLPVFKGGSEHHSTHAYGYIARAYAQLLLNEIQPDSSLLYRSNGLVEYLTTFHGMDITGTVGAWEHFNTTQEGIGSWGETCATAYEIRLLDKLLRIEKNSLYGDMMERIIYNALFAAQSPEGRDIRYFTPYEDTRMYYPDDYFCCPNNFRRIISELPEFIYYTSDEGIYINLYTPSTAAMRIGKQEVQVEQKTSYPSTGEIGISVSPKKTGKFTIFLRIPSWCDTPSLRINGKDYPGEIKKGHFLAIEREWVKGDSLGLTLPMPLRLIEGSMSQYGRVALMRGPLVYCMSNTNNEGLLDPALRKQKILIDPTTFSEMEPDTSLRPGGTMFSSILFSVNGKELKYTRMIFREFINPEGIKTFFDLPEGVPVKVVPDEFLLKDEY
jgi:DUF1680 family protein